MERRIGDGNAWERIVKLPGSAASYTDSQLASRRQVAYRVRAANGEVNRRIPTWPGWKASERRELMIIRMNVCYFSLP